MYVAGLAADSSCPPFAGKCVGWGSKPYCDGGRWMCSTPWTDTHHDAVTAAIWGGIGAAAGVLTGYLARSPRRPLTSGLIGGAAGLVALYAVAMVSYGK